VKTIGIWGSVEVGGSVESSLILAMKKKKENYDRNIGGNQKCRRDRCQASFGIAFEGRGVSANSNSAAGKKASISKKKEKESISLRICSRNRRGSKSASHVRFAQGGVRKGKEPFSLRRNAEGRPKKSSCLLRKKKGKRRGLTVREGPGCASFAAAGA